MSKKIIFRPTSPQVEGIVPLPKPAKSYIPEWFKSVPYHENNEPNISDVGTMNTTMKACMPFLDTLTSGYIQETWCDIYIDVTQKDKVWKFSLSPAPLNVRNNVNYYPRMKGFSDYEFAWQQPWIPELPSGYSMLYCHPFNRYDLPFISLSGIIDNDKYFMEVGANHPFFVTEDFKGVIPKGTPMFHIIPIKRDHWKRNEEKFNPDLTKKFLQVRTFFTGGYKKLYWQKKRYE